MPVIKQARIQREDLQRNRDRLYLFGDNEMRSGLGGQAGSCRGEPNAVGVATKRRPSRDAGAYWSDGDFNRCRLIVDSDLERAFVHARAGGTVVIPEAGLGTGLSELPARAPRLFAHIEQRLRELQAI